MHNPLVQVLFVMQNTPQEVREFGGLKPGVFNVSSTTRYDLVLFVNDPDSHTYLTWMYNPNLFDATTIAKMASLYEVVLQAALSNPAIPLSELSQQLSAAEQQFRHDEQGKFQQLSLGKLKGIRRKATTAP